VVSVATRKVAISPNYCQVDFLSLNIFYFGRQLETQEQNLFQPKKVKLSDLSTPALQQIMLLPTLLSAKGSQSVRIINIWSAMIF
jgi:hypothetical protein